MRRVSVPYSRWNGRRRHVADIRFRPADPSGSRRTSGGRASLCRRVRRRRARLTATVLTESFQVILFTYRRFARFRGSRRIQVRTVRPDTVLQLYTCNVPSPADGPSAETRPISSSPNRPCASFSSDADFGIGPNHPAIPRTRWLRGGTRGSRHGSIDWKGYSVGSTPSRDLGVLAPGRRRCGPPIGRFYHSEPRGRNKRRCPGPSGTTLK